MLIDDNTNVGRIKYCNRWYRGGHSPVRLGPQRAPIGRRPSCAPKTRMRIKPSQKPGTALNMTAITREMLSNQRPLVTADNTPMGIPKVRLTTSAATPSSRVAGSRSIMTSMTGIRRMKDRPKSPRRIPRFVPGGSGSPSPLASRGTRNSTA